MKHWELYRGEKYESQTADDKPQPRHNYRIPSLNTDITKFLEETVVWWRENKLHATTLGLAGYLLEQSPHWKNMEENSLYDLARQMENGGIACRVEGGMKKDLMAHRLSDYLAALAMPKDMHGAVIKKYQQEAPSYEYAPTPGIKKYQPPQNGQEKKPKKRR